MVSGIALISLSSWLQKTANVVSKRLSSNPSSPAALLMLFSRRSMSSRSKFGLAPADPEMAGSDRRRRALRQADDRGRRQVERKGEARFLIAAGTSVMAARLSKGSVPGCVTPRSPSWRHGPEVLSAPDPEVS
jgi:hypothetical protein